MQVDFAILCFAEREPSAMQIREISVWDYEVVCAAGGIFVILRYSLLFLVSVIRIVVTCFDDSGVFRVVGVSESTYL